MSAKAFYHKTPPSIPALEDVPPEIWSLIIQYAADSGSGLYEYEMTPSEHADLLRGEDPSQKRVFFANFRTRSYLSRVNKTWYQMAAPFLFEYIHLANGRKIPSLCDAILRSREVAPFNGSTCPFGWWTKRLDLTMREPNSNVKSTISRLADMVPCFTNLRIFMFSPTGHDYIRLEILSLLDFVSAPATLKAILWPKDSFSSRSTVIGWTPFLERHPALQLIQGPGILDDGKKDVLNSLKALKPHLLLPKCYTSNAIPNSDCHLPNIRSLVCYTSDFNEKFFQRVGKQLSLVDLDIFSYTRLSTSLFGGNCPNLVQINLAMSEWSDFQERILRPTFFPPKSLKILGIYVYEIQISGKEMRRLFEDAFPMFRQTSITTIRILTERNVKAFRRHPRILEVGVRRLASLGIALIDHNSQPMLTGNQLGF